MVLVDLVYIGLIIVFEIRSQIAPYQNETFALFCNLLSNNFNTSKRDVVKSERERKLYHIILIYLGSKDEILIITHVICYCYSILY